MQRKGLVYLLSLALLSGCVPIGLKEGLHDFWLTLRRIRSNLFSFQPPPVSDEVEGAHGSSALPYNLSDQMQMPQRPYLDYGEGAGSPPSAVLTGLDEAAFAKRLSELPMSTRPPMCAQGVRLSLNELFGEDHEGKIWSAKDYNAQGLSRWQTPQAKYQKVQVSGAQFQDFDVRVLQPSVSGNKNGHLEIFYKGQWYSDFKQRGSLWDTSPGGFQKEELYRLSPKTVASFWRVRDFTWPQWIWPEAQAAGRVQAEIFAEDPTLQEIARAKDRAGHVWMLKNEHWSGGSLAVLYKVVAGQEQRKAQNRESAYFLLENLEDTQLAQSLMDSLVATWIRVEGRAQVQARILEQDRFVGSAKEAYLRAGLRMPERYKILVADLR